MKFIHTLFTDKTVDGISCKRAITVFAFLMCAVGFIGDLFWDFKVDPNVYDAMMYIVIAGLGFTASEKFAKKDKKEIKQ